MENITHIEWAIYAVLCFLSAILSGIAGGGGGFIMTPLLIFFGVPPAQAVGTGKFSGLSVTLGSIGGLKGVQRASNKRMWRIVVLAAIVGLLAPLIIARLESDVYRTILGVLLLLMIPLLILKKVGHVEHSPSPSKKAAGYVLLLVTLGMQGVFSTGMGMLVNIVLMAFLGMPALEANITKRYSQIILNSLIILGLLSTGLIIWPIALTGAVAGGLGGYVGGKLAVKKGNTFVMTVMMILMFVAAMELLLG